MPALGLLHGGCEAAAKNIFAPEGENIWQSANYNVSLQRKSVSGPAGHGLRAYNKPYY